jgi:hypothetical protein
VAIVAGISHVEASRRVEFGSKGLDTQSIGSLPAGCERVRSTERQTVAMAARNCPFPDDLGTLILSFPAIRDTRSIMPELASV